jgi:WD40 repeat protein
VSTDRKHPPRALPDRPNLRHLKDQAKDLVKAGTATSITDAQFKIARLHGFPSWPKLKAHVESLDEIGRMKQAIDISDGVTGRNRALQLPVHTTEMYGAFSPDRSRLLTGGDGADPKVHIWDVETGKCLYELTGHRGPVAALGWTVDQQWIASGAFDHSIRLWDVRSGECLLILEGHRPYVRSVDFSQSREQLLSGGGDGVVRLWALPTGKPLQVFEGHTDGVYHAVFDASQSRVLTGGRDRTIRLWDISTGRCLTMTDGVGIQCLAWHADQRRFLSSARDIRLWDSETGVCLRSFQGHSETIRSVAWSHDYRHILSASHDRSVRIWESETGRCIQVLEGHEQCVVNAVWSLDHRYVLSCDSGGGLRRWAMNGAQDR